MSYKEIMSLPYGVFLSYLKQARVFELEKTEEGQEILRMNKFKGETEPDMARLRTLKI